MSSQVTHQPNDNRYVLTVDGEDVGVADYIESGDRIIFSHTGVAPAQRNNGYGALLVRGALDDVRERTNASVVPSCWFVRKFIDENPDYQDLLKR